MIKSNMTFPDGEKSHIAVIDGIVSVELLNEINHKVLQYRHTLFKQGKTGGGVMPNIKRSLDLRMTYQGFEEIGGMPSDLHELELELARQLNICIGMYEQIYFDCVPENGWDDSGFQYQLYEKGVGFYRTHTDSGSVHERMRVLSVIVYTNTVLDGGGTEFPLHGVTVDAVAGRVCIFPADWTMPHRGLMPISSDKTIINTFLKGNTHGTTNNDIVPELQPEHHDHVH